PDPRPQLSEALRARSHNTRALADNFSELSEFFRELPDFFREPVPVYAAGVLQYIFSVQRASFPPPSNNKTTSARMNPPAKPPSAQISPQELYKWKSGAKL
ncbi:MAG: hypothetical protein LBJ01_12175, partial [Tannerella sp.]|nr:hypothetical protein [Tannerella sp.]